MSFPLSLPKDGPLLTVTHPSPALWVIELHNGDDSRLTHELINHGLKPALDAVERDWRTARLAKKTDDASHGALVIVGKRGQDKFFSNGLDYETSSKDSSFFPNTYDPLLRRLITFPLPTIAAVNGHCFAGGMMLALACDYRVMTDARTRRAWMSMNEIEFGAPWPTSFGALLRAKAPGAALHRAVALEGRRFTPQDALAAGLVDELAGPNTEAVLAAACERAAQAAPRARTGVWGIIKRDIYRDVIEASLRETRALYPEMEDRAANLKARL